MFRQVSDRRGSSRLERASVTSHRITVHKIAHIPLGTLHHSIPIHPDINLVFQH